MIHFSTFPCSWQNPCMQHTTCYSKESANALSTLHRHPSSPMICTEQQFHHTQWQKHTVWSFLLLKSPHWLKFSGNVSVTDADSHLHLNMSTTASIIVFINLAVCQTPNQVARYDLIKKIQLGMTTFNSIGNSKIWVKAEQEWANVTGLKASPALGRATSSNLVLCEHLAGWSHCSHTGPDTST